MIILYIVLGIVACGLIGKLVNRAGDTNIARWGGQGGQGGPMRPGRFFRGSGGISIDQVENPRALNDGTSYGYKEFD